MILTLTLAEVATSSMVVDVRGRLQVPKSKVLSNDVTDVFFLPIYLNKKKKRSACEDEYQP